MTSAYITSYLLYPPNLNDQHIRAISGVLVNGLFIDQPVPYDKFADITYESEFDGEHIPRHRVIKMSKTEYINSFFETGKLQLGTFKYYNQFDNPEIGDKSEGSFIIVGQNEKHTAFAEIGSGFNNYVFCCFDGEPDPEVIERFGYDDYFEIVDINGFSEAISNAINARTIYKSRCIYKKDKVLVGQTPEDFDFSTVSVRLNELANESKYFIKTNEYKHQNEYRFIWDIDADIEEPIIIDCLEATKFCKRKNTD
ncbi:MAG: hypothetical protein KDD14_21215 [Saprospiraceae bacterium]|nr:hypothetical protein [Saprospiraceae bacterium]